MSPAPRDDTALRWIFLHPTALPGTEANVVQTAESCRALAAAGDEVFLVVPRLRASSPTEALAALDVEPHERLYLVEEPSIRLKDTSGLRSWRVRAALLFFLASLARRRPALLYFRSLKDSRLARFCLLAGRLLRLPVIYEVHKIYTDKRREQGFPEETLRRIRRLEGRVLAGADGLVAIHPLLVEHLREHWPVRGPIITAPNGVRVERAPPKADGPDLVYSGSLFPWKGVDLALDALVRCPDLHLSIVGGHPPARLAQLRERAERLGLGGRVRFLGHLPRRRALDVVSRARAALVTADPSFSELERYTCPLKMFEAMALGTAVVAADTPAVRAFLRPDREAVLFRPGDASDLARVLRELFSEPARLDSLASAARQAVVRFSFEERSARIRALARRLLRGEGGE